MGIWLILPVYCFFEGFTVVCVFSLECNLGWCVSTPGFDLGFDGEAAGFPAGRLSFVRSFHLLEKLLLEFGLMARTIPPMNLKVLLIFRGVIKERNAQVRLKKILVVGFMVF